jgi:hypothetical protein
MSEEKKQELEFDENGEPIFNPQKKWMSVEQIAEMYNLSPDDTEKLKKIRENMPK